VSSLHSLLMQLCALKPHIRISRNLKKLVDLMINHRSGPEPSPRPLQAQLCLCTSKLPKTLRIPGTCVQYPGLQGGGALGDASTTGTPVRLVTASAHGGTYSHVAVAGGARGGERGVAAATTAAAARRRRATPTRGVVTPPRSAPAHDGRSGRHGARAAGWDRPRAMGRLEPRRSMGSEIADEPPLQKLARRHDHPRVVVGWSNPGSRRSRAPHATRGGRGGQGGRRPVTPVAGQFFSAT